MGGDTSEVRAATKDGSVQIVYQTTDPDDPSDPDFVYTQGLNAKGLPEFLGLGWMASVPGLLALAEAALAGTVFAPGDLVRPIGQEGMAGLLVPVDPDGRGNWYAQWFGNPLVEVSHADYQTYFAGSKEYLAMATPLSDVPPRSGTVHDLTDSL